MNIVRGFPMNPSIAHATRLVEPSQPSQFQIIPGVQVRGKLVAWSGSLSYDLAAGCLQSLQPILQQRSSDLGMQLPELPRIHHFSFSVLGRLAVSRTYAILSSMGCHQLRLLSKAYYRPLLTAATFICTD